MLVWLGFRFGYQRGMGGHRWEWEWEWADEDAAWVKSNKSSIKGKSGCSKIIAVGIWIRPNCCTLLGCRWEGESAAGAQVLSNGKIVAYSWAAVERVAKKMQPAFGHAATESGEKL